MFKSFTTALASTALITATPALAQSTPATAAPAFETVDAEGASALAGGGNYFIGYALLATVLAGAVFGIIEFTEDDDPDYAPIPVSP